MSLLLDADSKFMSTAGFVIKAFWTLTGVAIWLKLKPIMELSKLVPVGRGFGSGSRAELYKAVIAASFVVSDSNGSNEASCWTACVALAAKSLAIWIALHYMHENNSVFIHSAKSHCWQRPKFEGTGLFNPQKGSHEESS